MSVLVDEAALAQRVAKILAETLRGADTTVATAVDYPLTIDGFCKVEGMSRATFYKLKQLGLAPELTEFTIAPAPGVNHGRGMRFIRISSEAHQAWRKKMARLQQSKAAALENARRRVQAATAAKLAVASPAHVSRRPRPVQRRGGRR
jgi:hypothetical protein